MQKECHYDLFFDESGTFMEASSDPEERMQAKDQNYPSQIVGFLAPKGTLDRRSAERLLQAARTKVGTNETHATEIGDSSQHNDLTREILDGASQHGWQPVRLVNEERVQYGDRATIYVNMVAELLIRIFQQKLIEGEKRVTIHVTAAIVLLEKTEQGELIFLEQDQYIQRVRESLAITSVRKGLASRSACWKVGGVRLRSGKNWSELQLCDHISNASYRNFRRCDDGAKSLLKSAFGPYDQTLHIRDELERAVLLAQDGSLGSAVRTLGESLMRTSGGTQPQDASHQLLRKLIIGLVGVEQRARDAQLAVLVTWLEQLIELQRSLDIGLRAAEWMEHELASPLCVEVEKANAGDIDSFCFAVATWKLMAYNHKGDLVGAARESAKIGKYGKQVALNGEAIQLLVFARILLAVHETDCFDHIEAVESMEQVVQKYGAVVDLLVEEFSDGAGKGQSDLRAMALGTQAQALMFASLGNPILCDKAREVSDSALSGFRNDSDRCRQLQYRAQIETFAGNYVDARQRLAEGIGADGSSHDAIRDRIVALDKDGAADFPLLHWLRLGATLAKSKGANVENSVFLQAFEKYRIPEAYWMHGNAIYPTHGILRYAANIFAVAEHREQTRRAWKRLCHLFHGASDDPIMLRLIQVAAGAELIVLCEDSDPTFTKSLLRTGVKDSTGVPNLCVALMGRTEKEFPRIFSIVAQMHKCLDELSAGANSETRKKLLSLARRIGY
jgi:hypothetical protein